MSADNLTLYERSAGIAEFYDRIADAGGEITPEQEAEEAALNASRADKIEACCMKRAELMAVSYACDVEAGRLAKRARTMQARAEWMDRYMMAQMMVTNTDQVQTPRFTVTLTQNPPSVAALMVEAPAMRSDIETLPEPLRACVKVVPAQAESYKWNKAELLKLAKDNPDAVSGVAIIERSNRVVIS